MVWLGAIFGGIAFLLHLFVYDAWVIPGTDPMLLASIQPTLFPEDRVLVRRGGTPKTGDLARCASPEPGADYVIGRVMGGPGDPVEIREERVYLAGKPMPSRHGCPPVVVTHPLNGQPVTLSCRVEDTGSFTYSYLVAAEYPEGTRTARVEMGKLFLVSDNRHIHKDSRDFGQVDASTCEPIVFRLWGDSFVDTSRRFTVL